MMCVHFGRVCFMVFNRKRERWEYIPEKRWMSLSDEAREQYDY